MLVLSREVGTSIVTDSVGDRSIVTVVKLRPQSRSIWVRIAKLYQEPHGLPGPVELAMDAPVDLGNDVQLSLVDLRGTKAHIGIAAPPFASVHRVEVYEEIRRANRDAPGGDDGLAGAGVPHPSSPKPPSLNVRLTEPRPDDEGG